MIGYKKAINECVTVNIEIQRAEPHHLQLNYFIGKLKKFFKI